MRKMLSLLTVLALAACTLNEAYALHTPAWVNFSPLAIASGGTWQVAAASNSNRISFKIQNPCTAATQGIGAAESIYIAYGSAPTGSPGSFSAPVTELSACGSDLETVNVTTQAIYIYAATTGHVYAGAQQ